jgi:hypothetical protein
VKRKNRTSKPSAVTRASRYLRKSGDAYLFELGANGGIKLDELSERRSRLLPLALIGLVGNICVWAFALVFPYFTSNVYGFVTDNNLPRYGTLLSVLALAIPFTPPFVSVFALLSLRGATDAQPAAVSDVMASFQYAQTDNRRSFILIVSGICGALNCFFLLMALLIRTGN